MAIDAYSYGSITERKKQTEKVKVVSNTVDKPYIQHLSTKNVRRPSLSASRAKKLVPKKLQTKLAGR
ncbi:uncharacterized protein ACLA_091680 [Aspergillus clavatus NRRL 1]|uniref:Uncharacterized protein n=1 Tax=Aspergillus clavatus (strain ATCC 1007 / CBS 513.65 / DSM 816 / NCTC 3887 / NRRL 1 / QM 1276 / 107) TaxID=344612 RepID=A1CF21_ASPCL|nr:uncharacterized protein ACLA_091680 [Aspergillus clavatus NRRL 1]EAW11470.1 hypothetical protein ACLA_091680 [Aspergillus clavatus NRRL 1]